MATGPVWTLEDDRKHVTVTFPTDPPVQLRLDVGAVEDMLRNLGEFRGGMLPEVPREYAFGQKVLAVPDPIWRTQPDAMLGNSLLHVRDPRFGWLHYLIPKLEALKLATFLKGQAEAPDMTPATKN